MKLNSTPANAGRFNYYELQFIGRKWQTVFYIFKRVKTECWEKQLLIKRTTGKIKRQENGILIEKRRKCLCLVFLVFLGINRRLGLSFYDAVSFEQSHVMRVGAFSMGVPQFVGGTRPRSYVGCTVPWVLELDSLYGSSLHN